MSIPGRREDGSDTHWYRMYRKAGRLRCYRKLGTGNEPPRRTR